MSETDSVLVQQARPKFYVNDSLAGYVHDSVPRFEIYDTSIEIDPSQLWKPSFVSRSKWRERNDFIGDWAVITFTLSLILLAYIRNVSEKYLDFLFQSVFNYQTAQRLFREKVKAVLHPSFLLDILFYLVVSTFIFHIEKYVLVDFPFHESIVFIINLLVLWLYLSAKYGLYKFIGNLFNQQLAVSECLFNVGLGNKVISLVMMPVSLLLFFSNGYTEVGLLATGAIIMIFFLIIIIVRVFRIISKKDIPFYYLILYLCTLEILPLLIVWKILWSYIR